MKTPDKIYIDIEHPREPYGIKKEDSNDICYIRRDALMEYINKELAENRKYQEVCPNDRYFGGICVAFEHLIDKIESL